MISPNIQYPSPNPSSPSRQDTAQFPPVADLKNWAALEAVNQELEKRTQSFGWASSALLSSVALANLIGICLSLGYAYTAIRRIEKLSQIKDALLSLLNAFETDGIDIFPLIDVPGYEPVDLFIRFPDKQFLLVALRSFGDRSLVYNEKRQVICSKLKKGKRALKPWKPDPLLDLSEQEFFLRKTRKDLFGGSARASRRPMAKVLAVCGKTRIEEHNEALYTPIGHQKTLWIFRKGTGGVYVIEQSNLSEFVRSYLDHRNIQDKVQKA
jgi:hypothetical protein